MKKLFTTILLLISAGVLFAQQDALFSQYMFNKLSVNPGYAGSRDLLSADLIYRYQWVNIDGAPKTISASLHSPLNNPHLALGMNITNDKIGPTSNTSAMATFAYRILFPKSKLSFGIQAGVKSCDFVWNDLVSNDENDPFLVYRDQLEKKVVPDANFGVYYYSEKFYAGLSSRQLLQNQTLVFTDTTGNSQFTKLLSHFYGMAGAAIPLNENVVFRPSFLAKYVKNAPPQFDINASFLFANTLWLGVSYRTEKAVSFITEINIAQNLRIGYSYDIWLNELKVYNKGSHEIRLSFDFNVAKRILTPRYF
ncbi:MAG: type IX secretion system membrane protein PorP/SprF [Bacteroidales bacterium]|jgi:type IX secretion system PorP/SprF family membrane protein